MRQLAFPCLSFSKMVVCGFLYIWTKPCWLFPPAFSLGAKLSFFLAAASYLTDKQKSSYTSSSLTLSNKRISHNVSLLPLTWEEAAIKAKHKEKEKSWSCRNCRKTGSHCTPPHILLCDLWDAQCKKQCSNYESWHQIKTRCRTST